MKKLLIAAALLALPSVAEAGCSAWDYVGGRWICTQSQRAECVEWGTVGGRRICIRSQ